MTRLLALGCALLATALLGTAEGSAVRAQTPTLFGSVGDGIDLRDAGGARVTTLDPGTYEITVDDRSDFHNFHLQGPGVDETTGVEFVGKVTWTVTFRDGQYMYLCDVHPVSLRRSFTAGSATPPTTPPPSTRPVTAATKLVLTSGPEPEITLRTSSGRTVTSMRRGTYTVTVRDRSRIHNARIVAPGYRRATQPLTYTGTQKWKVKLARTGTLRFLCDPHARLGMKGSAKIVR